MIDSILMQLSQFTSTDLKEFRDWKSILHTTHLLGIAQEKIKERRETHSEVLLGYRLSH